MAQTAQATSTAVGALTLGETDDRGEVEIVLVKFNFKDDKLIPIGIPRVERQPDYRIDVARQLDAYRTGQKELGKVGRIRKGRVDTGTQVISTKRPTQSAVIRRGLANNGFRLANLHWFSRQSNPKDHKQSSEPLYVVVACFIRGANDSVPTTAEVAALRALASMTWSQCFVWDNPNQLATINFLGRLADQKPKQSITVRDGSVVALDVDVAVMEEQE